MVGYLGLEWNITCNLTTAREDFSEYAKGSKAVKALLEREGRPSTPGNSRKNPAVKIDKAVAAFKAIDTDNSGFLDREEFLKFTRYLDDHSSKCLLYSVKLSRAKTIETLRSCIVLSYPSPW